MRRPKLAVTLCMLYTLARKCMVLLQLMGSRRPAALQSTGSGVEVEPEYAIISSMGACAAPSSQPLCMLYIPLRASAWGALTALMDREAMEWQTECDMY